MKKYFLFSFLFVCIIGISGCKKTELTGSLSIYAGTWEGFHTYLELKEDGTAFYHYDDGVLQKLFKEDYK